MKDKGTRKNGSAVVLILILIYLLIPLAACIIYSLFADWTGIYTCGVSGHFHE